MGLNHLYRVFADRWDRGQDLVEYALLIVLIALAATAGVMQLGDSASQSYADAASCVGDPKQAGSRGAGGGQGLPGNARGQGKDNRCPKS